MSKRHSLNVTMGPRPLHLVDGNSPSITQLPSPSPTSPFAKPNIRRHSSISYRSSNQTFESPRSSLSSPQPNFLPSSSPIPKECGDQDAHKPLTLVEKHSDLLHFIAQKESKCLELRSQLAVLEAEILQLKRKWERIVNRGFLNNPPTSQANSAVIEGFVEGVQGVSRFIAAGLAIGEEIPRSPSPSPPPRSLRPGYSSQSNPSTPTYTAIKPTSVLPPSISRDTTSVPIVNKTAGDGELTRILMVHDTGATPTMSPNPAFEHQLQQQQWQADSQSGLEVPLLNASKLYRRKSVDVHSRVLVPSEASSTLSQLQPTLEATEVAKKEALRAKRATLHGTNLPPVSSIPGLATLTVEPALPVPSWVESIGKKWEELQGSTFSKKQKRASTLLSGVSQSIVSALSSPSTLMSTSSHPVPSYFDPSVASAEPQYPSNRTTGTSLDNSNILASPRTMLAPKPCPDPIWQPLQPTPLLVPVTKKTNPGAHGEDEWNW